MPTFDLPIWKLHRAIVETLGEGNQLVLVAPTGSGKTTQVPQMLLDGGLAGKGRIIVLQPRRVAARTVAARVAWERQSRLGDEVGYQIRFEDRTSLGTRICFVTEGILLRWLQSDPDLREVAVVLFDEFHERTLLSDVALALAKQLQRERRPDLKLVVMSATLEAEPVAAYLASAPGDRERVSRSPMLHSEGRTFPVEVRWQDYLDRRPVTEQAADAVERLIQAGEGGHILVFMPGMAEINATLNALRSARLEERPLLIPLHGDLPPEDQDRAFQPAEGRKVIVATNVAETSVTIDGVRHVIDSGLARVARYDPERGIQTLLVEEISRASADQRSGRAGRTAPGTSWRLWTESGHLNRPMRNTPEIQRADLAEVVLLLHSLGVSRAVGFDWLDHPDPAAVERAERLLITLGALTATGDTAAPGVADAKVGGALTEIGRRMLRLPMHPRFSRMLVEAARHDCVPAAALCAALVSGRDLLMRPGREDAHLKEARELFEASDVSDFYTLMRAQQFARNSNFALDACRRYGIYAQTARLVEDTFQQLLQIVRREGLLSDGESSGQGAPSIAAAGSASGERAQRTADPLPRCLLAGFVDQLAIRRSAGTLECDLTEGRTAMLMRESVVQEARMLVAATVREVTGRKGNMTLLGMATAVEPAWLQQLFPQHRSERVEHLFDRTHKRVAAVKVIRFLDLVIGHEHQADLDPAASGRCLAAAYERGLFELPGLTHEVRQFRARVNLVSRVMPELEVPPLDHPAMLRCLARAFADLSLVKEAQAVPLLPAFQAHLPRDQHPWIDELAPVWIEWPEGKRHKLTYQESEDSLPAPEAQVKLTDCLAARTHPTVCEGKLPIVIWLVTPDGKRLASTVEWPVYRVRVYPTQRASLQKKFPGLLWP